MTTIEATGRCRWVGDEGKRCELRKAPGPGRHYCTGHSLEAAVERQRGKRRRFERRRRQEQRESLVQARESVVMKPVEDAHAFAIKFLLRRA